MAVKARRCWPLVMMAAQIWMRLTLHCKPVARRSVQYNENALALLPRLDADEAPWRASEMGSGDD